MLRLLIPIALAAAFLAGPAAPPALPQARPNTPLTSIANLDEYAQLDINKTLFMVMAAINAAGYDADADSPTNHPLRKAVRDHLAALNLASVEPLRRYVREHKPKDDDPGRELSQYISFALLSKGPPDFTPFRPGYPQPSDAAALFELPPLLAAFYKEANLEALWAQAQPYYEQALAEYTDPVSQAVLKVNAYMRNPTSGYKGRRFFIFVDLLGAPNQVQTRAYLDDYIVVVTPSAASRIDDIRHHYLNYIADVYPIRYSAKLDRIKPLADYALGSPILDEKYKTNFTELATESFIEALDARITRRPQIAEQAAREGFVLAPVFVDGLKAYEAQEREMRLYFPEMIDGLDLRAEAAQLDNIDFVSERAVKSVKVTTIAKPPELTGAAKAWDDAENLLRNRDAAGAKAMFELALEAAHSDEAMRAKATYGLARVAILDRDPETADRLFRQVLELKPDAHDRSWSLLYLGKLWDSQGEAETALGFYRQALTVEGLPDQVRREAEQGVQGAFKRASTAPSNQE